MTLDPSIDRTRRFQASLSEPSGVEAGYRQATDKDPLNKNFVRRNLRSYKTLKRFGKRGGLDKLRTRNMARLEQLAVAAVLKKNKVKRRKLKTTRSKRYGANQYKRARKKIREGYDIRYKRFGQQGLNVKDIKNKRIRKATTHLVNIRRNRRINKTKLWKGVGYDIRVGHR